jgi:periplasmic divalent cation tolerance protein
MYGMEALLVLTNLPDEASARALAEHVVTTQLAACVNILPPCRSVYRWQGRMTNTPEVPLFIKTTRQRYADLAAAIRARHPYELPEIVAIPITAGLPAYLDWLTVETTPVTP